MKSDLNGPQKLSAGAPPVALGEQPWPSSRTAWYAVAVLSLAYILSYVDRILINLMVVPIKADLQISDTQFGLLTGVAFGLCYTLMAFPFGRLADSYSRRGVAIWGVLLFSAFTAFSGLARDYIQLFLARMGVGLGEASLTPAAYSTISDYFPPERLARAMSVFVGSAFLGIGVAYIAGGAVVQLLEGFGSVSIPWVGELRPWQMAFILVSLPGIAIALLLLTVPEPARRGSVSKSERRAPMPLRRVVQEVSARRKALGFLLAGFSLITVSGVASTVWTPAFFIRTYGWTPLEVGFWYGVTYLAFALPGAILGGWLCDRLTARGYLDAPLRVAGYGYLGTGVFGGLAPLMPSPELALLLLGPAIFLSSLPYPLAGTAIQLISPNEIRGQITALYQTVINVVGLGFGPLIVGLLTDYVFLAEEDVRYSLAVVNFACAPLAFGFLMFGLKPFRELRSKNMK